MQFDHLAIQIPSNKIKNTIDWYTEFFNCKHIWTQSTSFAPLTLSRIPGILKIVELESSFFRFHIFTKEVVNNSTVEEYTQYHHLGFSVNSSNELLFLIEKWKKLHISKKFVFVEGAYVTDLLIDAIGIESIYFTDVNGLEYEVTYIPNKLKSSREY